MFRFRTTSRNHDEIDTDRRVSIESECLANQTLPAIASDRVAYFPRHRHPESTRMASVWSSVDHKGRIGITALEVKDFLKIFGGQQSESLGQSL